MKKLLILILIGGLIGCAGDGDSTTVVTPPSNPPPTCKSLFSVWTSTTDDETFDFTDLENEFEETDFEYKAHDGVACGYKNNPNHSLSAQILVPANPVGYDYMLKMKATLKMVGSCAKYYQPGSSGGGTYIALIIVVGCNQIQVCDSSLSDCKDFQ